MNPKASHATEPKARKSALLSLATSVAGAIGILFGLFVLLFLLALGTQFGGTQVLFELIGGFVFFLKAKVPLISPNPATWVPGVAALVLAAVGIHLFLRPWAVKRGKRWPVGNSLALAAVIPVLFVIAFLVPGILLQVQGLSGTRWFYREQGKGHSSAQELVKGYQIAAFEYAVDHDDKFPETEAELPVSSWIRSLRDSDDRGRHYWDRDLPREPVIYLGAGLTIESEGSLALAISPPFSGHEGRARYVATIGSEVILIRADEADAWIQRSLDARQASSP